MSTLDSPPDGRTTSAIEAPPETSPAAPDEAPKPRRRGWSFWLGLALIAAGLGMLGYVGWQMYGTTVVSKREQARIVEDLETQWGTTEGAALEPRDVPRGDASAIVKIPRFGKDFKAPVLEGTDADTLTRGIGHFTDSAQPGEVGNYALAGHRITHGEPFRDLPKLRPGDEIIVETARATYVYELITNPNDLIVDFSQVWVVDPLPDNPKPGGVEPPQREGQRLITLTTCSELFATDNRMIAFGVLKQSTERTGA